MSIRNLFAVAGMALSAILAADPAWAGPSVIQVPEPMTMSIVGLGIGAAMLIGRRFKK